MPTKIEDRLQYLEISRGHLESELTGINKHLGAMDVKLSNHVVHLQEAVRLLGIKSYIGMFSDTAILITTLVTMYLALRH